MLQLALGALGVIGITVAVVSMIVAHRKTRPALGYYVDSFSVLTGAPGRLISISYMDPEGLGQVPVQRAIRTRLRLVNIGQRPIRREDVQLPPIRFEFRGSELIGGARTVEARSSDGVRDLNVNFSHGILSIDFDRLDSGGWISADFLHDADGLEPRHPPEGHVDGLLGGEIRRITYDDGDRPTSAGRLRSLRSIGLCLAGVAFLALVAVGVSAPSGPYGQYFVGVAGPMDLAEAEVVVEEPEPISSSHDSFVFELREEGDHWADTIVLSKGWHVVEQRKLGAEGNGEVCRRLLEIVEDDTSYRLSVETSGTDPCGGELGTEVVPS